MSLINNEQKMLDIIFAKRNKSYGAYAIRSAYGSTIFRSLFIVLLTVLSSAGLAYWLKDAPLEGIADVIIQQDTNIKVIVCRLDPPKPFVAIENTKGGSSKPAAGTPTIVNDVKVDTAKQFVNIDLHPNNTSTSTGDPNIASSGTTSSGSGTTTMGVGTGTPLEGFGVDENPEFEGGHNALLAFVRKNLVYPSPAVNEGKQGTLYVKFVVDESGKVTNIILQNNLGYGLDDEAMRVVKMIPKFKSPGKVKGQPVKTYYQIPIKFKLG